MLTQPGVDWQVINFHVFKLIDLFSKHWFTVIEFSWD